MYKLKLTRRERKELALTKWLLIILAVLGIAFTIWLAWVRPAQQINNVGSFDECRKAGNQIQESYPEVCLTKSGKRFVNPVQDKAHQDSLQNNQELAPPADPSQLHLDVDEWDVRIPLTEQTFDLIYAYLEDGLNDRLTFTFKRLVNAGLCTSEVGFTLTRMTTQRMAPFSATNPAPIAHIGSYYYYPATAGSPCYDPEDPAQAALVKEIAGEQSLTQVVGKLMEKLQAIPE